MGDIIKLSHRIASSTSVLLDAIDPDDASNEAVAALERYLAQWPDIPEGWGTRAEHIVSWLWEKEGLAIVFAHPDYKESA